MGLIIAGIKGLIIVILGAIYLPLNMFLNWLGPIQMGYWKERDYIMAFIVALVFLPVWAVTTILSAPYEMLVESAAH